jgi:hypothetical protein
LLKRRLSFRNGCHFNTDTDRTELTTLPATVDVVFCTDALSEKFTWLVTEKARDRKYSHCAGKFTDTMRVKDQIEYFLFDFSIFLCQNTTKLDWI